MKKTKIFIISILIIILSSTTALGAIPAEGTVFSLVPYADSSNLNGAFGSIHLTGTLSRADNIYLPTNFGVLINRVNVVGSGYEEELAFLWSSSLFPNHPDTILVPATPWTGTNDDKDYPIDVTFTSLNGQLKVTVNNVVTEEIPYTYSLAGNGTPYMSNYATKNTMSWQYYPNGYANNWLNVYPPLAVGTFPTFNINDAPNLWYNTNVPSVYVTVTGTMSNPWSTTVITDGIGTGLLDHNNMPFQAGVYTITMGTSPSAPSDLATVHFTISGSLGDSVKIVGADSGSTASFNPQVSIQRSGAYANAPSDVTINGTYDYRMNSGSPTYNIAWDNSKFKTGSNTITVKDIDGNIQATTTFTILRSGTNTSAPIIAPPSNPTNSSVLPPLPVRSDYDNTVFGSINFGMDTLIYYIKAPFLFIGNTLNIMAGWLTQSATWVASVTTFFGAIFGFLPAPITGALVTIFSVIAFFTVLRIMRG